MTEYSISVDWSTERQNYENRGRQALENNCKHKTQDKDNNKDNRETNLRYSGWCEECEVYEDSAEPMMNYVYPLYSEPSEEQIIKVCEETCLTVMENNNTGEYFLVLCGGGMDLSQDIALAYILCDERIPDALAYNVSTQHGLSKSGDTWVKIMEACEDSLILASRNYKNQADRIKEALQKQKVKP